MSRDLDRASQIITETLHSIEIDAEGGRFSTYAWSPFAMAALAIVKHQRYELWQPLTRSLVHPTVSARDKVDALEVIVDEGHVITPSEDIKGQILALADSRRNDVHDRLFMVRPGEYDAALRNFLLACGVMSSQAAQTSFLRDAASVEPHIRTAAVTGSRIAAEADPLQEWPIILLIQLSHDHDALVRNSAARELGHLSVLPEVPLKTAILERVTSILDDSGIAMPMGAMMGMVAAIEFHNVKGAPLWCSEQVATLAQRHPSRNIHAAARMLLQRWG